MKAIMTSTERQVIAPNNDLLNISRRFNIPHSPGIRANGFIFLSGMIAIDPVTGARKHGTIEEEARQILDNITHMLESVGSSRARIVRVLVMLTDMTKWDAFNDIYREYFPHEPPARSAIGVTLNNGMKIEIECTALE
jgi:2-iminobutanoate/2-iminopropanoate deaminase